jgi:hypothetical protein
MCPWTQTSTPFFSLPSCCFPLMQLVFGVIDYNRRGGPGGHGRTSHAFFPLLYAQGLKEREEVALLALLCLKQAAKDLLGINDLQFYGGLVSDHAWSFTNAYQRAFPNSKRGQCWPHIVRKFKLDCSRKNGQAGYFKYCSSPSDKEFLTVQAVSDVRMLHGCKSDGQFHKMASLVLESWRQAGQSRIADIFQKEYIDSVDHNNWRYGCFGIPGDSPQNNSIERDKRQC